MATNDLADQTIREAEQRAERAKASLLSRVELLKHKLTDARQKLDLQAQIARHPLPAVGIAFALGAAAGLRRTGSTRAAMVVSSGRSLRSAAVTALAAFGLHLVREIALGQLGQVARRWWAEAGSGSDDEAGAPRSAGLE